MNGTKEGLRNLLKDASSIRFVMPVPYEIQIDEEVINEEDSR